MPLESGTRLGPYEVIAPIGDEADERYKATDTRRQHVVALKILPPDVASSPGTKARLERDVRTISALNHPGISAVVDVGHQDPAISFVVAELVEGESLAQRLTRGPLELPEALRIAIAIAESLDQAHRRDVVHRGLNPSVVMLAPSGPKVLDFGVANAAEAADQVEAETMAATRTSVASLMAIPTAAAPYMAPEQFAGQRADARADIFALGAILYEMVTGRPAFNEKTQALLIAAVQTVDPDPASKVRPEVPVALDFVIARCLTKDPRQRIQTAFDVLTELQWIAKGSAPQPGVAAPSASVRKRRDRVVWIGVAAVAALAAALAPSTWARFARAPEPEEVRFVAAGLPTGTTPISLSPDGRWVTASINGGSVIGLALDSVTSQALINGVPFQPFWSADSRSIAYFEAGKLKRADIGGGPPQIICDIPAGTSAGTWNRDGVILFPGASVIQRVLAAGGQPQPVTTLDQSKQETEHVGPVFLRTDVISCSSRSRRSPTRAPFSSANSIRPGGRNSSHRSRLRCTRRRPAREARFPGTCSSVAGTRCLRRRSTPASWH